MLEHLPTDISDYLHRARNNPPKRRGKLRLQIGQAVFPILRHWDGGFAIDAARLPQLRGFVEIHEGGRLIRTCLIIASQIEGHELICTVKRSTLAADRAAPDYWLGETETPIALPRP